jgi:multiple sugar transport system permease protein
MADSISLMNTFWALVLPGLANGYGIFLLKGFFDSLPPELYEAGLIDGAGELRMFWRITLPMSKPILAVIALGAFSGAYGAFMHAFLICQDPRMWTLMVFLYEFQQMHTLPLVMASLVVAAIPTLLVFVFCQNVILRGIVIPTFK